MSRLPYRFYGTAHWTRPIKCLCTVVVVLWDAFTTIFTGRAGCAIGATAEPATSIIIHLLYIKEFWTECLDFHTVSMEQHIGRDQ